MKTLLLARAKDTQAADAGRPRTDLEVRGRPRTTAGVVLQPVKQTAVFVVGAALPRRCSNSFRQSGGHTVDHLAADALRAEPNGVGDRRA
jgi:hypothetical protein